MDEMVQLLVIESEEIYAYMYEILNGKNDIKLLGRLNSPDAAGGAETLRPDVILLGAKRLDVGNIRKLVKLFPDNSEIGLIVLFTSYNRDDIQTLRRFAPEWRGGMGVFLRQSLGHIDQLINIIKAVRNSQVILDPSLAYLMFGGEKQSSIIEQLTHRELEVLHLLANGKTNTAIADALFIDVKTVEHHLNSMYSKIKAETSSDKSHPRVTAARLYLEEVGELIKTS